MTPIKNARRRVPLALATLVASGAIAACGSSSSSSSSSTSTSASASASSKTRSAFVACLQQHGITPPPGGGNGGTPPGGGNGGQPPAGANGGAAAAGSGNSARQAAFKACGGLRGKSSSSQSSQK